MKTEITRDDIIKIRGEISQVLTNLEFEEEVNVKAMLIAAFRAIHAALSFLIRKTWGE